MTTPPHLPGTPTGAAEHRETADADPPFSWAAPARGDLAPPPPVAPEAWGPPPSWQPPVATKKRVVWPWFVAGGAVVFVVLVVGVIGFAIDRATADQNANYDAEPIAVGDVPEHGDYVIISDNGKVAFDGMDEWYDASAIPGIGDIAGGFPDGATMMGTYFTSDPTVSMVDIPALVLVVEGADPGQVASVDIARTHDEIVKGAMQGAGDLGDPTWQNGPTAVTSAHGLEGFKTEAGFTLEGLDVVVDWYTFARKERVVMIQIASYDGSPAVEPAQLITDSLRIDP